MDGRSRLFVLILAASAIGLPSQSGCNTPARRSLGGSSVTSSGEPPLTTEPASSESVVVEPGVASNGASAKSIAFVDRHPLLRKPQQYYDNTNSNKVVKTAAAAFVGVPVGLAGEVKQIFVGTPSSSTPAAY